MDHVTILGPIGATFSSEAYEVLSEKYSAPKLHDGTPVPAATNAEIVRSVLEKGGYGAIATETYAEGRVAESLESLVALLQDYNQETCPFVVAGAVRMRIHFCLMVKLGTQKAGVEKIIAHQKAIGACKGKIAKLGLATESVSSNGEAARLIAEDSQYENCAALAPSAAAKMFNLQVLEQEFEDREAITTFLLMAPKQHTTRVGEKNKALVVFRLNHVSGALVHALKAFADSNLNLTQIHSVYIGELVYDFAIELDISGKEIEAFNIALQEFKKYVQKYIVFGPFEVSEI